MGRLDVKKGDLVCLYRRKTPGLGIVMDREDDTYEKLESNPNYYVFMDLYVGATNWRAKKKACDYLLLNSGLDEDLVYAFLICNSFYGANGAPSWKKFKRDFILVKWFTLPSNYESDRIHKDILWLPTDWFKKVS